MAIIRLTKCFDFETAHALWGYHGKCKHIHGHSYILQVTVIGEPEGDSQQPTLGMVMDFGDLKHLVKTHIVDVFDHALVLNEKAPISSLTDVPDMFDKIIRTPYQPTCENMINDFANRIIPLLSGSVSLHHLRLYETANSYAEWWAEDNK